MAQKISYQYYDSPAGELIIGTHQEKIVLCDWRFRKMRKTINQRISKALDADFNHQHTLLSQDCIEQLQAYFTGNRKNFNLPINSIGTAFQKKVWNALEQIPYGETRNYEELSETLGDKKAVRVVAAANGANAIAIIIPCHRVIGKNGKLTGYAGGLTAKKRLLTIEKASTQLGIF